jgi:hypothetical protein
LLRASVESAEAANEVVARFGVVGPDARNTTVCSEVNAVSSTAVEVTPYAEKDHRA